MTPETQTVFEKYEVRKTKKQKKEFIGFVTDLATAQGYECKVEKGFFGVRNIVVGNVDAASVVYTAHYDTCAEMPFPNFITPKNFLLYLLYQLLIVALLFAAEFVISFSVGIVLAFLPVNLPISEILFILYYVVLFLFLLLITAGPANKHTANDNTSGVTVLIDTMTAMPDELKNKAAFVFFDLEEAGLFGSSAFAKKHKKAMKNKLLINFDCVSDGFNIIFALKKRAKKYAPMLNSAFPSDGTFTVEVLSKGVFYPSDQANFNVGVGVAALKKSKKTGILYMDRIHTKKDTVYQEENIDFLKTGSIKLTEML